MSVFSSSVSNFARSISSSSGKQANPNRDGKRDYDLEWSGGSYGSPRPARRPPSPTTWRRSLLPLLPATPTQPGSSAREITRLRLRAAAAAAGTGARWRRRGSGQAAAEAGRGARLTRQNAAGEAKREVVGRSRPRKLRYCPAPWLAPKIAHEDVD